jgi:ketosteroid isomerase-like protein
MSISRRRAIATGAAAALGGRAASAASPDYTEALVSASARANAALMRGDVGAHRALVPMTEDFTLMSPFGGTPSHGVSEESWEGMRTFFRNGSFAQEVIETYSVPDMVVLVLIERTNCEVGGLPAQDWGLRVTLVYRRDAGVWRLAHRHADPLARAISLVAAAALAG